MTMGAATGSAAAGSEAAEAAGLAQILCVHHAVSDGGSTEAPSARRELGPRERHGRPAPKGVTGLAGIAAGHVGRGVP